MPPRPRTAVKAAARVAIAPKPAAKKGVFARLKAEAGKEQATVEPYVIDDVEPPIVITAPTETERQLGIAELFGSEGEFEVKDARRILELVCGDAFEQVWELVRREHVSVMLALITDMGQHFQAAISGGAGDFPGGSEASST